MMNLHPAGPGLLGKRSVLGVREVAALWHPPGERDETPLVERSGSRALSPSARSVSGGALVGDTTAGASHPIRFPEDLLRRHHLYVARTRMGKSTLMHHMVAHKLREKAEGRDNDAIVVVDPHADLVAGILEQVPESLIDRVRLIDLGDRTRAPGINLLDTRVFADRDRTADSVVRVARGLWEQWGPRMQSILEQTVKTLHEANEHPDMERRPAAHHPGRAAPPLQRPIPQLGAGQGLRPLHPGVVGQGLRRLAPPVPGRGPGPGADETVLLRVVQAGAGHPGPAPLHHRPAGDHPGRRRPAGVHLPGDGGPGRGRTGGRVPAQPGGLGDPGAGGRVPGPAPGRPGGGGRDAVHARRGLRVNAVGAGQVRRVIHPGHPEPGQAGGPLPHHAGHPAGQRGLPGSVPGGGQRRKTAGVGVGPGPGVRGGHRFPGRAPLLRAGHRGHRADARLLHDGAQARGRRPRSRPAHPRRHHSLHPARRRAWPASPRGTPTASRRWASTAGCWPRCRAPTRAPQAANPANREVSEYRRLLAERQNGGNPGTRPSPRRQQTSRRSDGAGKDAGTDTANKEGGE